MPEFGADTEILTLSNLCNGELAADFAANLKEIMGSITGSQKGTISITLEIKRAENTQTMVNVGYAIKHALPAKKQSSMCFIDGALNVKTEQVKERRSKIIGIGMFPKQE